jgi:arginase family enzyme
MAERDYRVFTSFYSHRIGVADSFAECLDFLRDGVDVVYVSIDIDVVDGAYAPGTGVAIFEGLTGSEFLEVMRSLAEVEELVAFDVCEVDPEIDHSGRTQVLAANAILAIISKRVLASGIPIPANDLLKVFHV